MTTLKKMIGQMLIFGFRGCYLHEVRSFIKAMQDHDLGGVILFDKDAEKPNIKRNIIHPYQLAKLIEGLQRGASTPLWVSVDQEGGAVMRLKAQAGFETTPSPQVIAQMDEVQQTYRYADQMARQLKRLGINLNYFPSVDVNVNLENPIIGALERSFSHNPSKVIQQAECFLERFRYHQLAACLKHFPGHGSSIADSHLGFVDISDGWSRRELMPYFDLIQSHAVPFVMLGHVFHRDLDKHYPASLSPNVILGLLRKQCHFQGMILTDDLQMQAISAEYDLVESIVLALNAGVDVLLFGNNIGVYQDDLLPQVVDIILQAVRHKHVALSHIEQAYARIKYNKQRYHLCA